MSICPTCYRLIGTWTDDPVLTKNGLSGTQFMGLTIVRKIHFKEIQDDRIQAEIDLDVTPKTTFTTLEAGQEVTFQHIQELRTSTEKILTKIGRTKEDYFNYDEDGNDMAPGNHKMDWSDPLLDDKLYEVKAIHLEDLRHFYALLQADLIIFSVTPTVFDNHTEFEIIIKNIGQGSSVLCVAEVNVTDINDITLIQCPIKDFTIPVLIPDETCTIHVDVPYDPNGEEIVIKAYSEVDKNNAVAESDESNNTNVTESTGKDWYSGSGSLIANVVNPEGKNVFTIPGYSAYFNYATLEILEEPSFSAWSFIGVSGTAQYFFWNGTPLSNQFGTYIPAGTYTMIARLSNGLASNSKSVTIADNQMTVVTFDFQNVDYTRYLLSKMAQVAANYDFINPISIAIDIPIQNDFSYFFFGGGYGENFADATQRYNILTVYGFPNYSWKITADEGALAILHTSAIPTPSSKDFYFRNTPKEL